MKRWSIAALVLFAAGEPCAAAVAAPYEAARHPNLVLITLDTTRADYLGCYGQALPTSPALDRLAARGVRFSVALTQIPLTGPSHATMFTGLYPHRHGAIRNGVALPADAVTLAERLREEGYRTAAFLSGWTLRANLSGLAQGFDTYDDRMQDRYRLVNSQRFAHQVTPLAMDWLASQRDAPFFLWVHYFDPHYPYNLRPELVEAIGGKEAAQRGRIGERELQYASEVRYMDEWIGSLLTRLDDLRLTRNTLVVVAGDHGEALGEHGYVGHGREVYEEILLVPFLLSWPGHVPEGLAVESPVALLDLTPTVLSLLGLPPQQEQDGIDLAPFLDLSEASRVYADRQIRFETYPGARKPGWRVFSPELSATPSLVGYRQGTLKFVHDTERGTSAAFDLGRRFAENVNVIDRYPGLRDSGEMLVRWVEENARIAALDPSLSDDDRKALKSLGY